MSSEHGNSGKTRSKHKSQDAHDIREPKKRKRITQDDHESPIPKKKHRLKSHPHDVEPQANSSVTPEIPRASSFYLQTSSMYLPLSPIAQNCPLEGLCAEHLSPLILTYYPPLRGTILSYHNPRLSTTSQQDSTLSASVLAHAIDEHAAPHIWLTAEFLLLRPKKGDIIEGWINLQNEGNIGLVCWNFFNASIERKRLPKDWKWKAGGLDIKRSKKKLKGSERDKGGIDRDPSEGITEVKGLDDAEGHFRDGDQKKIKGLLQFTVKDVETSRNSGGDHGFLSIEGTLLDEIAERDMRKTETRDEDSRASKHRRREQSRVYAMSGALRN
ncbi:MAG: hypothetical protein Q9170_005515 [Blastenia crenularia]